MTDKDLEIEMKKEICGTILIVVAISLFIVLYKDIFDIAKKNYYNTTLDKLLKDYGDVIVELNSEINKDGLQVVEVKNFNEMLDLEEELKIPIMFYEIEEDELGEFILLFGVFIFLKPDMTVKTVSFLLGIILLISGLNNIVSAFNNKEKLNDLNIAIGIIIIVASLVLFFNPTIIASIIPLLIGIYMIISSAFKLQYLYSLKELTNKWDTSVVVIAIITLILGVLLVFNPFGGVIAITKLIGIFLVIYAILDIVNNINIKKKVKEVEFIK